MKHIVLIGFMGTGKSTIAKNLSHMLQMEVLEMDEEIACREGMSIPEIFRVHGEAYFREKETELLVEIENKEQMILSCGGGTPLRECNVIEMKKNGIVIWLTAEAKTIWKRIKDDKNRPLLKGNMNIEYIQNMIEQRHEKYQNASDLIVKTDGREVSEICEEIIDKLKGEVTHV